jgi:hypothetical protein
MPYIGRCRKAKPEFFACFVIFCFYLASVFDPSGLIYNFRGIAVFLMFFFVIFQLFIFSGKLTFNSKYLFFLAIFSIFLPIYGLAIAAIRGGLDGTFIDTSYIASGIYLSLSVAICFRNNVVIASYILISILRVLSFLIIFVFFARALNLFPDFVYVFVILDLAFIGDRMYGGMTFPYIYFITSPMLVFLLSHDAWYFFEKKSLMNLFFFLFSFSALFLSGTRASMAASLITPLLIFFWRKVGKLSIPLTFFFFIISLLILSILGESIISDMINLQVGGNKTKLSYISHYFNIFSDPWTLLFGQGYNAHAWSSSVNYLVSGGASKSELTYLELVRVFGLPVAFLAIFLLFYLPFSGQRVGPHFVWVKPAFLVYLVMSSLNPYLFSINGMSLLGFTLAVLFYKVDIRSHYIKSLKSS